MPHISPFKLPIMCTVNLPVCSSYLSLQSNPEVQDWMKANSLDSLSQLETYFEGRVLDLASLAGRSYIVWQVHIVEGGWLLIPSCYFASDHVQADTIHMRPSRVLFTCAIRMCRSHAPFTCAVHMCCSHAPFTFNCMVSVEPLHQPPASMSCQRGVPGCMRRGGG